MTQQMALFGALVVLSLAAYASASAWSHCCDGYTNPAFPTYCWTPFLNDQAYLVRFGKDGKYTYNMQSHNPHGLACGERWMGDASPGAGKTGSWTQRNLFEDWEGLPWPFQSQGNIPYLQYGTWTDDKIRVVRVGTDAWQNTLPGGNGGSGGWFYYVVMNYYWFDPHFSGRPAPGIPMHAEYSVPLEMDVLSGKPGTTIDDFEYCANENGMCQVPGSEDDLYWVAIGRDAPGPDRRWNFRAVGGGSVVPCKPESFQSHRYLTLPVHCKYIKAPGTTYGRKGYWQKAASCANANCNVQLEEGLESSQEVSQEQAMSYSKSVTKGFEAGGGFGPFSGGVSKSVTSTYAMETAVASASAFTKSMSSSCEASCTEDPTVKKWTVYQWQMEMSSNSWSGAHSDLLAKTCNFICVADDNPGPVCPMGACGDERCLDSNCLV